MYARTDELIPSELKVLDSTYENKYFPGPGEKGAGPVEGVGGWPGWLGLAWLAWLGWLAGWAGLGCLAERPPRISQITNIS